MIADVEKTKKSDTAYIYTLAFRENKKAAPDAKQMSYAQALDEVVAESAQRFLLDSDAMNKLAKLSETNKSLAARIVDKVRKLLGKLRAAFRGAQPQGEEAQIVETFGKQLDRLEELWAEGLVEATRNYKAGGRDVTKARALEMMQEVEQNGAEYSIKNNVADDNGMVYKSVVQLDYGVFNKIKHSGNAFVSYIRNNLINKKIPVYNKAGNVEMVEFARENERVKKEGAKNFHRVLGELEKVKSSLGKLVILNAEETAKISSIAGGNNENSHQWLDYNGWTMRNSYVMTKNGIIYPVVLSIAHTKDGRNILYHALVKINEGVSIDKNATSLQNKSEGQAVKVETPSASSIAQGADSVKPESQKNEKKFEFQRKAENDAAVEYEMQTYRDLKEMATGQESVTARERLSSALEDIAVNETEKNVLKRYKSEIAKYEALEQQLRETRREIRKIESEGGTKNNMLLKYLRDEATKLSNNLKTYDSRLLKLENTKPLRDVVARAKQETRQQVKAKAIKEYGTKLREAKKEMNERIKKEREKKYEAVAAEKEHQKEVGEKKKERMTKL